MNRPWPNQRLKILLTTYKPNEIRNKDTHSDLSCFDVKTCSSQFSSLNLSQSGHQNPGSFYEESAQLILVEMLCCLSISAFVQNTFSV